MQVTTPTFYLTLTPLSSPDVGHAEAATVWPAAGRLFVSCLIDVNACKDQQWVSSHKLTIIESIFPKLSSKSSKYLNLKRSRHFFFSNEHAFAISKVKACIHINHFNVCITTINSLRNVCYNKISREYLLLFIISTAVDGGSDIEYLAKNKCVGEMWNRHACIYTRYLVVEEVDLF